MHADPYCDDAAKAGTDKNVSAADMGQVLRLLRELRDLTQSRKTFAIVNDLIARLADDDYPPNLVHDEPVTH